MLIEEKPWKLKDALGIIVFRVLAGFLISRILFIYSLNKNIYLPIIDRLIMIFLTIYVVISLRKGQWSSLGLGNIKGLKNLFIGIGSGIVLIIFTKLTFSVLQTFLSAELQTNPLINLTLGSKSWQGLILPLLIIGILTPIGEEIFYRGLLFNAFKSRLGFFLGAIISGIIFALAHFNLYWLFQITLVGTFLALLFHYTRSLTPGIIAHSLANSFQIIALYLAK